MHYRTDACIERLARQATAPAPPKQARGRPRIHADRKAYRAQYERERGARLKKAQEPSDH